MAPFRLLVVLCLAGCATPGEQAALSSCRVCERECAPLSVARCGVQSRLGGQEDICTCEDIKAAPAAPTVPVNRAR